MKIALIGAGGIAQKVYLPILTNWEDHEIIGVFSRSRTTLDKIRKKYGSLTLTTNVDDLVNKKPDAVFVLTNNQTHFKYTEVFLKNGADVFVEKPLAQNSIEVELLAKLAEANKRILMVAFNRRFSLLYQKAKELFINKKIQMILIQKNRPYASHINLYNNYLDDTIHQIDLLRFFCGEVTPINSFFEQEEGKMVGAVSACRLNMGGIGLVLTSLKAGSWQENVTIHGDHLTVEVDAFEKLVVKRGEFNQEYGVDRPGSWIPDMDERGFSGEIAHFFDCVSSRQQPQTNGYDALKTHQLIEALVQAAGITPDLNPSNGWDEISRFDNPKPK
jgi:virulence factor